LEVPPRGLGQDHLVQRQITHGASQPGILILQLLQPLQLISAHATILFTSSVTGLLRYADLSDRVCDRAALSLQHFNLPQLQHEALRVCLAFQPSLGPPENGIILSQLVDHFSGGLHQEAQQW